MSERPRRRHRVLGAMLVWTGGGLVLLCLWLLGSQWQFLRSSERAQGEVLSVQRSGSGGGRFTLYTLQVRFETPRGRVTATTEPGLSRPDPGGWVTVYYRAGQPRQVRAYSVLSFWFVPLVVGAVGAMVLAGGVELLRPPRSLRSA